MKRIWPFAFSFLFFASVASVSPYTVLYYRGLGFTGAQIGLLTGITPLITLFSVPLWTGLADVTRRHRLVMSLALLGGWIHRRPVIGECRRTRSLPRLWSCFAGHRGHRCTDSKTTTCRTEDVASRRDALSRSIHGYHSHPAMN